MTMPAIQIVLPPISDDRISNDLVWLTETLTVNRLAERWAGGILGGEYGYGVEYENDVFQMHPFCWCDRFECLWCAPCECGDDAMVYTVNGATVTDEEFFDAGGYGGTGNKATPVPEKQCANCQRGGQGAPNFLHKPTGTKVRWYKYIGRGMEVALHGDWQAIFEECLRSAAISGRAR